MGIDTRCFSVDGLYALGLGHRAWALRLYKLRTLLLQAFWLGA